MPAAVAKMERCAEVALAYAEIRQKGYTAKEAYGLIADAVGWTEQLVKDAIHFYNTGEDRS